MIKLKKSLRCEKNAQIKIEKTLNFQFLFEERFDELYVEPGHFHLRLSLNLTQPS